MRAHEKIAEESKPAESPHWPRLSSEELKAIERDVEKFLENFSRVHAAAIARNAKAVRYRLAALIASRFQLKRGPRPDARIVQAYRMLRNGAKRRDLLRTIFPGFDQLDPYGQHLVRKGFYSKLKRYGLRDQKKTIKMQTPKKSRKS